jgi:hypothetical protein
MLSILGMGGDMILAEKSFRILHRISNRTLRNDAIQNVKGLLKTLDEYHVVQSVDDNDTSAKLARLEEQLLQDDTDKVKEKVDPSDKRVVFVIMPFSTEFNDVWKGGIQRAANELQMIPLRVDEINKSSNITDDIVESIKKSHITIVDVTDNNPNVMFELGYALAKGKPNIIISQSADYLPFDIRNIRTIVYDNTWSGIEELRSKLKSFLQESAPKGSASKKDKSDSRGSKKK